MSRLEDWTAEATPIDFVDKESWPILAETLPPAIAAFARLWFRRQGRRASARARAGRRAGDRAVRRRGGESAPSRSFPRRQARDAAAARPLSAARGRLRPVCGGARLSARRPIPSRAIATRKRSVRVSARRRTPIARASSASPRRSASAAISSTRRPMIWGRRRWPRRRWRSRRGMGRRRASSSATRCCRRISRSSTPSAARRRRGAAARRHHLRARRGDAR